MNAGEVDRVKRIMQDSEIENGLQSPRFTRRVLRTGCFDYIHDSHGVIAPLQVHFYSEALLTQHRYCAGVSRQSATGKCELRTCPRSIRRLERESNPRPSG